jgi:hypothetical protein
VCALKSTRHRQSPPHFKGSEGKMNNVKKASKEFRHKEAMTAGEDFWSDRAFIAGAAWQREQDAMEPAWKCSACGHVARFSRHDLSKPCRSCGRKNYWTGSLSAEELARASVSARTAAADAQSYHGCLSGDCPHWKQTECDQSLKEVGLSRNGEIEYNWVSDGPDGCDDHNIKHPCGKCITGRSRK